MYFFLKAFSLFLKNAPSFAYKITYKIIYSLLFHVLKMRKKVVLQNLLWAFPEKDSLWRQNIMKKCYKFYSEDFLDFISFPKYYNASKIRLTNIDMLSEALSKKKGVILVGSHHGSFDKLFYLLGLKGYDLTGVAYKQNSSGADLFFRKIRENFMKNQLYKGGNAKQLSQALSQNNILILLSDQDAKKRGTKAKFFDINSSTHSGAAILSKRKKSPLVYFSIVKKDDIYEARFEKIDTSGSIESIVQLYTSKIEQTIREYPEQYFWFHKRWKSVRKYK